MYSAVGDTERLFSFLFYLVRFSHEFGMLGEVKRLLDAAPLWVRG